MPSCEVHISVDINAVIQLVFRYNCQRGGCALCEQDRKQFWFPFSVLLLRCRFLYSLNSGYGAESCQPPSISKN